MLPADIWDVLLAARWVCFPYSNVLRGLHEKKIGSAIPKSQYIELSIDKTLFVAKFSFFQIQIKKTDADV